MSWGRACHKKRSLPHSEEFDAANEATDEDLAKVEDFARANDLDIVERQSEAFRGSVWTVAQCQSCLQCKVITMQVQRGVYRARSGPIYLPAGLAPVVQAVMGLDDRPQSNSHIRLSKKKAPGGRPSLPLRSRNFTAFPLAQTVPVNLSYHRTRRRI